MHVAERTPEPVARLWAHEPQRRFQVGLVLLLCGLGLEKQDDLRRMAREYLRRVAGSPTLRFDVVSVYLEDAAGAPDITLFKNAFPVS